MPFAFPKNLLLPEGINNYPNFVDFEIPSGSIDGINNTFILQHTPNPILSLKVVKNGLMMMINDDYIINNNTIIFQSGSIPKNENNLYVFYRY